MTQRADDTRRKVRGSGEERVAPSRQEGWASAAGRCRQPRLEKVRKRVPLRDQRRTRNGGTERATKVWLRGGSQVTGRVRPLILREEAGVVYHQAKDGGLGGQVAITETLIDPAISGGGQPASLGIAKAPGRGREQKTNGKGKKRENPLPW